MLVLTLKSYCPRDLPKTAVGQAAPAWNESIGSQHCEDQGKRFPSSCPIPVDKAGGSPFQMLDPIKSL